MEKKFEFTDECITIPDGTKLYRIRALKSSLFALAGDLGGFLEKEDNLSQKYDAWVSGNAWVSGSADYACVKGFGRECRNTTFFRAKDGGVSVVCGCFYGTLQAFREKVKETHGESKMAKEYLMIADLMEMHFSKEGAL